MFKWKITDFTYYSYKMLDYRPLGTTKIYETSSILDWFIKNQYKGERVSTP
jgi:hypothetical protein